MVSAILAAVIAVDQSAKWWAWRHVSGVKINTGGDFLVGATVGQWYAAPVSGAVLDLLDVGLLSIALAVLLRRRSLAVVVPGAVVIGGWASNLLDRLGLHYVTAPGSARGAMDFIHVAGINFNVADFFIMAASPLFVLAVAYRGRRIGNRPPKARPVAPAQRTRRPARGWVPAVAGAGLIMVVALGAAKYGGVRTPPPHVTAKPAAPAAPPAPWWPPA